MKKVFAIILVCLMGNSYLNAQNIGKIDNEVKTVFGNGGSFGGFLEFESKVGDVNGQSALLVGGKLSAVFSSKFNIGFAAYGLATGVDADSYDEDGNLYELQMGYGGISLEPVIGNKKMIHVTMPILLGVGGSVLTKEHESSFYKDDAWENGHFHKTYDEDTFLVVEPGLKMEINLLKFMRLNVGASYRYIHDNKLEGISNEELSGFTGSVSLKLGWF